jgi:hypothetical protein
MRIVVIVLSLLLFCSTAWALDPGFKDSLVNRNAWVTTSETCFCEGSYYGKLGQATYLFERDGYGYWLTTYNTVSDWNDLYVGNLPAEIISHGRSVCEPYDANDWAVLRTAQPLFILPIMLDYNVQINENLYYVNANGYRSITKCSVRETGYQIVLTMTTPQVLNTGAGVFNAEGYLVGIVLGKVPGYRKTAVLLIRPEIFEDFPEIP